MTNHGNLICAFEEVAQNRGAPGPDGRSIDEVRKHLGELLPALRRALLDGTYRPGMIRRVWIPKAGGGERGLGIPDVVDRWVQQAVHRVLSPHWDPTFHPSSHGFRPGRSCHTAIAEAKRYLEDGYEWVVDLDLEKFFDRVHHQRLMARLETKVTDRRLLALIHRMLKAKVVMPDGVVVSTDEGVPQGGPLSPLLSNIVLDELDREFARRGYHFVRYADDANIYVRSERAGHRVMASVVRFIEQAVAPQGESGQECGRATRRTALRRLQPPAQSGGRHGRSLPVEAVEDPHRCENPRADAASVGPVPQGLHRHAQHVPPRMAELLRDELHRCRGAHPPQSRCAYQAASARSAAAAVEASALHRSSSHPDGSAAQHRMARRLRGSQGPVGAQSLRPGGLRSRQAVLRGPRALLA